MAPCLPSSLLLLLGQVCLTSSPSTPHQPLELPSAPTPTPLPCSVHLLRSYLAPSEVTTIAGLLITAQQLGLTWLAVSGSRPPLPPASSPFAHVAWNAFVPH